MKFDEVLRQVQSASCPIATEEEFESARKGVEKLGNLTDEQKLLFYGLFKQATVGNVNISSPWAVEVIAKAKWNYWNKFKGVKKESAKAGYVSLYRTLAGTSTLASAQTIASPIAAAKADSTGLTSSAATRSGAATPVSAKTEEGDDSAWNDVDSEHADEKHHLQEVTAESVTKLQRGESSEVDFDYDSEGGADEEGAAEEEEEDEDEDSAYGDEGGALDHSVFSASDRDHLHFRNGIEIQPFVKSQRKLQTLFFSLLVMMLLVIFDYNNRFVLFKCVSDCPSGSSGAVGLVRDSGELRARFATMTAGDTESSFTCEEMDRSLPLYFSKGESDNNREEQNAVPPSVCTPEKVLPLSLSKDPKTVEDIIIN